MSAHFQREISKLKQQVLSLCSMVEGQVEKAVRAVQLRDDELAAEVERLDEDIDLREIEVEEECLKTLALYQPVAGDLRFVVSTLKINHDLERIGDLAVNIARKVRGLVLRSAAGANLRPGADVREDAVPASRQHRLAGQSERLRSRLDLHSR